GGVRGPLGKVASLAQRAVDLIRRNMQEAESLALAIFQPKPEGSRSIKQLERSDHVGLEKTARSVNRTIHMRFGGEVHNRKRPTRFEQGLYNSRIPDIASDECITGVRRNLHQVEQVSRIGELIKHQHMPVGLR